MRIILSFLAATIFFAVSAAAQIYIEPVIGYSMDINNQPGTFKMINSAIQFSWKKSSRYELLVQVQKNWPLPATSDAASFTANPELPLYASARKKVSPSIISTSIGHRFIVAGRRSKHSAAILLYTGITYQEIFVSYEYDKDNYIILNPDQSQNRLGLFLSGGMEYMCQLKNGRLFFQVILATPPSGDNPLPYSSFHFMAPLYFNAGYSILISK